MNISVHTVRRYSMHMVTLIANTAATLAMLRIDSGVMQMCNLPLSEKYTLTIKEAAEYFNIGIKKMRRLAEEHVNSFSIYSGNRYLIIRTKFEEYLLDNSTI